MLSYSTNGEQGLMRGEVLAQDTAVRIQGQVGLAPMPTGFSQEKESLLTKILKLKVQEVSAQLDGPSLISTLSPGQLDVRTGTQQSPDGWLSQ